MKNSLMLLVLTLATFSTRAQTLYVPSGTSGIGSSSNGNVGIGTASPSAKLEVNQVGGGSGQNVAIKAWAGNNSDYYGNTQMQFSYGGGGGSYNHAIKSRHNSGGIAGNAIDFYLWQPGDPLNGEGSLNTMTLNGGKVGIGTTSPTWQLEVGGTGSVAGIIMATGDNAFVGWYDRSLKSSSTNNRWGWYANNGSTYLWDNLNSSNRLTVSNSGNVGIGTTSPSSTLDVNGVVKVESTNEIETGGGITKEGNAGKIAYQKFSDALDVVGAGTTGSNRKIKFWAEGGATFTGAVGIGTTNPGSYKLAVEGKIGAREVNVIATNPWPDYVFEKNYKLPSLAEIKNYIDQNQHLPEVPSAKEVEKNGVNVGEMNAVLLKKIEELTLYILKQEDRATLQQEQIKALQAEVSQLKK